VTQTLKNLLKEGAVLGRGLVEVDGVATSAERLKTQDVSGAIVRISKHMWLDGKPLTVGAPNWKDLWD
jgi:hypothetical protein